MAIDIEAVRAQQRELNMISDEVSSVRRRLKQHQEALDDAWKSTEIKGVDLAIEEILRRLNRLTGELEDLGHDVMVTGQEIKAEEEAAAAAAEARRRAAEAAAAEEARRRAAAEAVAEEEKRRAAEAAAAEEAKKRAAAEAAAEAARKLLEKSKSLWRKK